MENTLENSCSQNITFNARVLFVEETPLGQVVAKEGVAAWGLDVDFVSNGQDAVERVSRIRYDLIFMDCQMAIMDGYTATAKIRELEDKKQLGKVPIIALTTHLSFKERMRILECGMDGHIVKPFQLEGFFSCLKEWLGDKMSIRSLLSEEKKKNETERSVLDENILDQLRQLEARGSSGLIKKLFKTYINSSKSLVREMLEDLKSGAVERVAEKSHTLKSASHHVGAVELSRLFGKLEAVAKTRNGEQASSLFLQVWQEYARVLKKIQEKLKAYGG